ncbi:MAG: T9SS type A sorting domain-containing protein [bacterium]|nr:T9SS type A sorting domain-containing protein [bacterium]
MKKSFLTLVAALVLFNANVFAGSLRTGGKTLVESGRTTELASWLKDICGATGSRTSYTITTTPNNNVGDVYFVGINNYWVGNKKDSYSVYDQVNRGVTLIDKVQDDSKQETSTGTFYTYQAKNANKFFFIVRAKNKKTKDFSKNMAFAYYNEYSYVDEKSASNIGYGDLTAKWNNLKDGEPFPAPHDCDTSLETNHYITLNDKEDDEAPLHNFTAFLYVPSTINTSGTTTTSYVEGDIYYVVENGGQEVNDIKEDLYCKNKKGKYVSFKEKYEDERYVTTKPSGDYEAVQTYKKVTTTSAKTVPYVFFYNVTMAEATLQANGNIGNACNYNVALNWSTVFDKYAENEVQKATQYDTMKEHYVLERSYDMTYWEEVSPASLKEVSGNDVRSTAGKKFVDTELKDFDETTKVIGYTVYYRVCSKVMKSDINAKMAETQSNIVTVNIPGTAPFSLTLLSGGTSKYDPTANNKAGANTFCNSLVAAETAAHAAVTLAEGAELSLIRVDESNAQGVAVKTVKVTDANISLAELVAQIANNAETGAYTEEFTTKAGESKDATYQLVLKVPAGNDFEEHCSNKATIANAKVNALAVVAHRSGTPDENKSDIDETFHNEVKFTPANTGIGTGYYIYRNGEQIADLVDNGNGTFSLRNTTEEIALNSEGKLVYTDLVDNAPIAIGETGNGNDVASWGYSVAHYDDSNNTYGSASAPVTYTGAQNELVVNTNGSIAAALIPSNGTIYVSTKVNWAAKNDYSDTQAQSYSVYRRIKGEETEYQLMKTVDATTTEVEVIDIYDREAGKTGKLAINEVKTYDFYVTMNTTNNELKNSQVYTPTISAGAIFTGIEEVEMAEIDVTVANGIVTVNGVEGKIAIYSINGQEVAMAEGDGSTTEIDVTSLEKGVYVVKADNMKSTKILIK